MYHRAAEKLGGQEHDPYARPPGGASKFPLCQNSEPNKHPVLKSYLSNKLSYSFISGRTPESMEFPVARSLVMLGKPEGENSKE